MCSYTAETLTPVPGCVNLCANCTWSSTVTFTRVGTNCVFDWTVTRSGCASDERNGNTTVACGKSQAITFYCDGGEMCAGYRLTLNGMPCPGGTGGA